MPELLSTHRALLERWRTMTNLVGPGALDAHYDDARAALSWLEPQGRWVDLGSGAGFPGIVFAAMFPELTVELVDSRKRRCAFLERVLAEAQTAPERVVVRCMRVEGLEPHAYDGVVSRAFAPPPVALAHAHRLLVPGGTAVLFLQAGVAPPTHDGMTLFHVEPYSVDNKARQAVGFRRTGARTEREPLTR